MLNLADEWLEPDGLGGFASGTVGLERTRRYHALLLAAKEPPAGRVVLVSGLEMAVRTDEGVFPLSSERYAPGVVHPDGWRHLLAFTADCWPTWTFKLPGGVRIVAELFVPHGHSAVVLRWRLLDGDARTAALTARPLISGRDYHGLHQENPGFGFDPSVSGNRLTWRPYPGVPAIHAVSNGAYQHRPLWFRQFLYLGEQQRGLDCIEDLASPGEFTWELNQSEAALLLWAEGVGALAPRRDEAAEDQAARLAAAERRRRGRFASRLARSADAYIVRRGRGKTIIAGYPWFTDWGRDTFIALRGLCLTGGRPQDAEQILVDWSGTVSQGMLPNRFPDQGQQPEYNSVDASLWYVVAAGEFLHQAERLGWPLGSRTQARLHAAIAAIVEGYAGGTRFGIGAGDDGLLRAGQPGVQLTWMDAKVGDWVVTPRIGKPVEVEALWINALAMAGRIEPRWTAVAQRARASFRCRFWNEAVGGLYDVVDADHIPGKLDATIRPNQILAVGGLPLGLLEGVQARKVVDLVEARLWTPLGLRSLDPADPSYRPNYQGGVWDRDGAYHQGTAWPWLLGPFVEAWVGVRGSTETARQEARERFLRPLQEHLDQAGLDHISEIADAEPIPGDGQIPRGCPFQAWSLGELIRLEALLRTDDGDGGAVAAVSGPSAATADGAP